MRALAFVAACSGAHHMPMDIASDAQGDDLGGVDRAPTSEADYAVDPGLARVFDGLLHLPDGRVLRDRRRRFRFDRQGGAEQ